MQAIEVYVFFLQMRMQIQDLKRVFRRLWALGDCAKWPRIAMLIGHFATAVDVGNTPFRAGYKHYKKSETSLYTISTLLKKYAD
ncbi:MAG: hypothetical protein EA345_13025 [Halomonas sp.]|nr:MAG: hypothetical protein EA345_13025 [Halomonas sp.]